MPYTLVLDNPQYRPISPELLEAFALNVPDSRFPHLGTTFLEYRCQPLEGEEERKESGEHNQLARKLIKISISLVHLIKTKYLTIYFFKEEDAKQFIETYQSKTLRFNKHPNDNDTIGIVSNTLDPIVMDQLKSSLISYFNLDEKSVLEMLYVAGGAEKRVQKRKDILTRFETQLEQLIQTNSTSEQENKAAAEHTENINNLLQNLIKEAEAFDKEERLYESAVTLGLANLFLTFKHREHAIETFKKIRPSGYSNRRYRIAQQQVADLYLRAACDWSKVSDVQSLDTKSKVDYSILESAYLAASKGQLPEQCATAANLLCALPIDVFTAEDFTVETEDIYADKALQIGVKCFVKACTQICEREKEKQTLEAKNRELKARLEAMATSSSSSPSLPNTHSIQAPLLSSSSSNTAHNSTTSSVPMTDCNTLSSDIPKDTPRYKLILDNPTQKITAEQLEDFALNHQKTWYLNPNYVPDELFAGFKYNCQPLENEAEFKENDEHNHNLVCKLIQVYIQPRAYGKKIKWLRIFFYTKEQAEHFIQNHQSDTLDFFRGEVNGQPAIGIISNVLSSKAFNKLRDILVSEFKLETTSVDQMLYIAGIAEKIEEKRENILNEFKARLENLKQKPQLGNIDELVKKLIAEAKAFDAQEELNTAAITLGLGDLFVYFKLHNYAILIFNSIKSGYYPAEYRMAQMHLTKLYLSNNVSNESSGFEAVQSLDTTPNTKDRTIIETAYLSASRAQEASQRVIAANSLCALPLDLFTANDFTVPKAENDSEDEVNEIEIAAKCFLKACRKIRQQEEENRTLETENQKLNAKLRAISSSSSSGSSFSSRASSTDHVSAVIAHAFAQATSKETSNSTTMTGAARAFFRHSF